MKKTKLFILAIFLFRSFAFADEGMWLPIFLKSLNEADMQAKGLKLSAEDIYSVNKSSLKDAIVLFGGGCTGELVSAEGLLLTNHHCGFSQIQSHSSVEKDYLTNGFWAMNREQELPNPGLSVTFIVRMEDVTEQVLAGLAAFDPANHPKLISENSARIIKQATQGTHYGASIKPFFYGAQYFMFVTETFKDVRLVGAPPSSIGKFGGDTDNWVWPRHTGDFSVFRVYAGADNKPASYAAANVPYKPKHFLPISLKGAKEGDFTMVFGFPGRTTQYLPSYALKVITEKSSPYKVKLRRQRLDIIDAAMASSPALKIKYADKQSTIANAWKKWSGELMGLKRIKAIEKKEQLEQAFVTWTYLDPQRRAKYGEVLSNLKRIFEDQGAIQLAAEYQREAAWGAEILVLASNLKTLSDSAQAGKPSDALMKRTEAYYRSFFKNYDLNTDRKLFPVCLSAYYNDLDKNLQPEYFRSWVENDKQDWNKLTQDFFSKTALADSNALKKVLVDVIKGKPKRLIEDPAMKLAEALNENHRKNLAPPFTLLNAEADAWMKLYVEGLREMQADKKFYPDANLTLRVAYGQVKSYQPKDGVTYLPFTYLSGIMEKEDPNNNEFEVPEKLKTLYKSKDFGQYIGTEKDMPVAFAASNHTTGGNSGSPVLDANGHLLGLNFDRCWEGTMSDIMYSPDLCRNIVVDIRYVLFIVDKFAGASHLVNEMKLVP